MFAEAREQLAGEAKVARELLASEAKVAGELLAGDAKVVGELQAGEAKDAGELLTGEAKQARDMLVGGAKLDGAVLPMVGGNGKVDDISGEPTVACLPSCASNASGSGEITIIYLSSDEE